MSVIRMCVRLCAVEAIRPAMWAGTRVYDSNNTPLDEAMRTGDFPWVTVFTDTDKRNITGRQVEAGDRDLHLICEMGIAGPMVANEGTGPVVAIPASDAGYERTIDIMEACIRGALFHDPNNTWGELFRKLVLAVKTTDAERTGEVERGARWAARFISFVCDTCAEPIPGVQLDPDHPVLGVIAALRDAGDRGRADVANLIEAVISGAPLPSWQQAQAMLGLTDAAIRGSGEAPPYATPATEVDLARVRFIEDGDRFTEASADEIVDPIELTDDGGIVIIRGDDMPISAP